MAILYAIGVFDEKNTIYFDGNGSFTTDLNEAVLFYNYDRLNFGYHWLPVFIPEEYLNKNHQDSE